MSVPVKEILGLLEADAGTIEVGRRRQESIWRNQASDYIPILMEGVAVPEADKFPRYNPKEQFHDREKMLAEQLWGVIGVARSGSDAQLVLRVNAGTGLLATVFGAELDVPEHTLPRVKGHVSKEKIAELKLSDFATVAGKGLMPMVLDSIAYFKREVGDRAHVYVPDTQGPFDLAHLVRGNDIFTECYDDPGFVHHLMELCTHVYIEATRVIKAAIGEDMCGGYHGNGCQRGFYLSGLGVRSCEDTTILLSPPLAKEFAVPYTKRAFSAFGGGFVHYCGDGNHILDLFMELDEVRGFDFGNPDMHDYEIVMKKALEHGKVVCVGWPRTQAESVRQYFERMLRPLRKARRGLLFIPWGGPASDWDDNQRVINLWRSMQDSL